jgi:hypothetical protein
LTASGRGMSSHAPFATASISALLHVVSPC